MSQLIAYVVFDYKYRKAKIPYIPIDVSLLVLHYNDNHVFSEFYNENHELIMVDPNMCINAIYEPSLICIGNYDVNTQYDMLRTTRNVAPFIGAGKHVVIRRVFTIILIIVVITIIVCIIVTKHRDSMMHDYDLYQKIQ